jgi:hypothetical protein
MPLSTNGSYSPYQPLSPINQGLHLIKKLKRKHFSVQHKNKKKDEYK